MKRLISLALSLMLLATSFAAFAEDIFPVTEDVTLKVAYSLREEVTPYGMNPYMLKAFEDTGVNIEWIEWNPTNAAQKFQLTMAGGDMPDIIINMHVGQSKSDVFALADQGLVIAWNDYMEYAPNLTAIFEMRPDIEAQSHDSAGKYYFMPSMAEADTDSTSTFLVCMDWLEKAGCEVPTNLDEFKDCLRAVKEYDYNGNGEADEIPLTIAMCQKHLMWSCFMATFGLSSTNDYWYITDDHEVGYLYATENYREAFMYLHELYEEGLLDLEFATMTQAEYEAKMNDEVPTVCFTYYWAEDNVNNGGAKYTAIDALEGTDGEKHWFRRVTSSVSVGAFITSACENPEIAVAWLDRFASEENSLTGNQGMIGGWLNKNEDGTYYQNQKEDGSYPQSVDLGSECLVWGFVPQPIEYYSKIQWKTLSNKQKCCALYSSYLRDQEYNWADFGLTEEESEKISLCQVDVGEYTDQMVVDFIVNGNVEERWNEYIDMLDELGLQTCIDTYQTAYDRYLGK